MRVKRLLSIGVEGSYAEYETAPDQYTGSGRSKTEIEQLIVAESRSNGDYSGTL